MNTLSYLINQYDSQGKKHGVWKYFYPNRTLWRRTHYHHGKAHGVQEFYWEDGTPLNKEYRLNIR